MEELEKIINEGFKKTNHTFGYDLDIYKSATELLLYDRKKELVYKRFKQ